MTLSLSQVQSYMNTEQVATPTAGPPPPEAGSAPASKPAIPASLPQPAPPIFYSQSPAILVIFEGAPGFAPVVSGSNLFFAVNTNWPVFQDKGSSTYFMLDGSSWLQAPTVKGPWQVAGPLPASINQLPRNSEWADVTQNIPGKPLSAAPMVFVSDSAAELILVTGQPQLKAIPGTALSWVTNSESDLFLYQPSQQWYYLVSGRWFSGPDSQRAVVYATTSLPADFQKIPASNPRAAVLASVPGTPQAQQAVAMAQMPHKADVNIATTTVNVTYGGPPQFTPIPGTTMQYATNTTYQVIQADGLYYTCYQAVWFVSQSPNGPWAVATVVPQVIYTIPPTSPMYNVTYVQIYSSTPTTVVYGYTSGYNGAYVSAAGVVMLGVGIALIATAPYYPPGFGYPVYYHPPYCYSSYGYHAGYNPYTGAYYHGTSAYGPYGGYSYGASYNPSTGTYARGASVTNAYGTTSAEHAYNPYTGANAATEQHSGANGSWGQSVASKNGETAYSSHASNAYGSAGQVSTSSGGHAAGVTTANGTSTAGKTSSGDQYASHDGTVYKNTGTGWQSNSGSGWNNAQKPASASVDQQARSSAASSFERLQQLQEQWIQSATVADRGAEVAVGAGDAGAGAAEPRSVSRESCKISARLRAHDSFSRRHRPELRTEHPHFFRRSHGNPRIGGPCGPGPPDQHPPLGHGRRQFGRRPPGVEHEAITHGRMELVVVLRQEGEGLLACLARVRPPDADEFRIIYARSRRGQPCGGTDERAERVQLLERLWLGDGHAHPEPGHSIELGKGSEHEQVGM